ncbi:MAG: hypothetical protein ABJN75_21895 [Hoeflea sp.]|uniref:hypothetical protein n=1 Tax=Hoeflea sp. TaxID=1940281 RepID=UPI003299AE0E
MRSTAWNTPITIDDPETGLHRTGMRRGHPWRCSPRKVRHAFIAAAIEAHLHLS